MSPYIIVVFGGTPSQLRCIESASYPGCELRPHTLEVSLNEIDFRPLPSLFLIVSNQINQKAQIKIEELSKAYPDRPRILVANNPTRRGIIQAFRLGVQDVFLFPIAEKVLRQRIEQLLRRYPPGWKARYHHWKQRLRRLFRQSTSPPRASEPESIKNVLGIMPAPALLVKQDRKRAHNYDLMVNFFGLLSIFYKSKKLRINPGRKITSVLAYLLFHHKKPVHREILMDAFWGDHSPDSARNSLNVAIHHIRKLFHAVCPEQTFVLFQNESYVINPQLEIFSDVEQFNQYWQKGRAIEINQGLESALGAYNRAVACYRGDLLENLPYETWCESERSNLRENYLLILGRLSAHFFQEAAYTAAEALCKKMLAKDPCLEDAHRRLIQCYAQNGLRDQAVRQYHRCVRILREELGVDPSLETQEVFLAISGISLDEAQKARRTLGLFN